MSIFKIVHITDLHFNPLGRIPVSRTDTFHEDYLFKWTDFISQINELKPDFVLISGDFFHLKDQSNYSPKTVNYYIRLLEEIKFPTYIIPGNHDMPKSSLTMLEDTIYRIMCKSVKNIVDVSDQIVEIENKEHNFKAYISGIPYCDISEIPSRLSELNSKLEKKFEKHKKSLTFVMLHTDVVPDENFPIHWETISFKEILEIAPAVNFFNLGHIHYSYPVHSRMNVPKPGSELPSMPQFIVKPWSFARVVNDKYVNEEDLDQRHRPSFALIDIIQDEANKTIANVEYREIKHVPFEQAFKRDSLKVQVSNSGRIKSFIEQLKENGTVEDQFTLINPEDFLANLNLEKEILDTINDYIQ